MITYKYNSRRCIFTGMTSKNIGFLSTLNTVDRIETNETSIIVWFKSDLSWDTVSDLVHLISYNL